MEFLRKFITLCQANYEKAILILALVGLAGAVVVLYQVSLNEEENLKGYEKEMRQPKGKSMTPISLDRYRSALQLVSQPPALDFGTPHHLFNPVKWQRKLSDGTLIKVQTGKEVGPYAMNLVRVGELFFIVSLDRAASTGGYTLGVTHEGAENPWERRKVPKFVTVSNKPEILKKDLLALREVKGTPEEPELIVELAETGEKISVTKDKPFKRVEGYEVDLSYPLEGKTFTKLRVNSKLHFAGEDYKVVAITPTEVVLSANLNDKKYTVRQTASR
jgi:hypothetical protein